MSFQNRFPLEGWYYAKIIWDLFLLPTKELRKIQCHGNCYFNAVFKRIKVKYRTLNCFSSLLTGSICSYSGDWEIQLHTTHPANEIAETLCSPSFPYQWQSIKSSNPMKWISVLNFCILKTVFPRPLIDKMDATFVDSSRYFYPTRTVLKPTTDLLSSFTKKFYSAILVNCKTLKEILLLFTCVFVSLHNAVKYVQCVFVVYIWIASFQKNWIGLLKTIFLSSVACFVLLRTERWWFIPGFLIVLVAIS